MVALLIAIVVALIIVIFAIQNAAVVTIHFLFWVTDLPLALIIFCSVLGGALVMFFLALRRQMLQKKAIKAKDKKAEVKAQSKQSPIEDPIVVPIDSAVNNTTTSDNSVNSHTSEEKK
ncbi:lipopolysaccharide assembly protein LapA domain-containing protein [Dehalobacter sp. DCM]|uniref:LapA family protein n=1 Tax=Dehalobacter sp. DCM TaxID=2907827 RepID=UPI00308155EC|nr:lipopolysaccharide assembly protein LapA domain-containing protein [Dehalobacter sp. DCM]